MVGTRTAVVRLLLLEVAKPRIDVEKEFDRTVQYILDTIDALKEIDRTSSRIVIQEEIIAQIRGRRSASSFAWVRTTIPSMRPLRR